MRKNHVGSHGAIHCVVLVGVAAVVVVVVVVCVVVKLMCV